MERAKVKDVPIYNDDAKLPIPLVRPAEYYRFFMFDMRVLDDRFKLLELFKNDTSQIRPKALVHIPASDHSIVYVSLLGSTIASIIILNFVYFHGNVGMHLVSFGSRSEFGTNLFDQVTYKMAGLQLMTFACEDSNRRFGAKFMIVTSWTESGRKFYTRYGFVLSHEMFVYNFFVPSYDIDRMNLLTIDYYDSSNDRTDDFYEYDGLFADFKESQIVVE